MAVFLPPEGSQGLGALLHQCPGLHGESAKVRAQRRLPLGGLLSGVGRLEVPLFQRSYCWGESEVEDWWAAVAACKPRSLGEILLGEREGETIVIDGQQRITTACVFASALRDVCGRMLAETAEDDGAFYVLGEVYDRLAASLFASDGSARLRPSAPDRVAFETILERGDLGYGPIFDAKRVFDERLAKELTRWSSNAVGRVRGLATSLLEGLAVDRLAVAADGANMCQIFLYVQEQSLLRPRSRELRGVAPTAMDLARNLLMSAFVARPRDERETVYAERWLGPVEKRFVDGDLEAFLDDAANGADAPRPCDFQDAARRLCAAPERRADDARNRAVLLYARFVSFVASIEAGIRERTPQGTTHQGTKILEMTKTEEGVLTPAAVDAPPNEDPIVLAAALPQPDGNHQRPGQRSRPGGRQARPRRRSRAVGVGPAL